jgi:hypothetical protein
MRDAFPQTLILRHPAQPIESCSYSSSTTSDATEVSRDRAMS